MERSVLVYLVILQYVLVEMGKQLKDNHIDEHWFFSFSVVPILHLELGTNMNPDDIEEGDDVYFECKVRANPWAYKVVWKHNVSRSHGNLFLSYRIDMYVHTCTYA